MYIPEVTPENAKAIYEEVFSTTYASMIGLFSINLAKTMSEQDEIWESVSKKVNKISNEILETIREQYEGKSMNAVDFLRVLLAEADKKFRRTSRHPMIVAITMVALCHVANRNLVRGDSPDVSTTNADESELVVQDAE